MNRRLILRLVGIYATVSLIYIFFSDSLLFLFYSDSDTLRLAGTLKGLGFVLLTAALLAWLLLRLSARETSRYRSLLDNHHAVMLVVDIQSSRVVDASEAAFRFYGWPRSELLGRHLSDMSNLPPEHIQAEMERARRNEVDVFHFRHRLASGAVRDVDVFAGPIELDGRPCLLAFITDVTERRRNEAELNRMVRLYAILSGTNQLVLRAANPQTLYQEICRIAVNRGGFLFCWVGIRQDDGSIKPVAMAGDDHGYVQQLKVTTLPGQAQGKGPIGTAMREGRPVISNAFLQDPATAPWHEAAQAVGIGASASFPFLINDQWAGTLNFYSGEPGYFGAKETETLAEVAGDVSFGLTNIQHMAALETAADVIDTSPVVLFRWRAAPGWPVAFVSANVSQWGYHDEDLMSGKIAFDALVHPDDLGGVADEVAEYTAHRVDHFRQEYRIRTAGGEVRWVADVTTIERDESGAPTFYKGTLSDITMQRQARNELAASEQRFRRAIEEAPFPILMYADDGEVLAVSRTWSQLSGYPPSDIPTLEAWTRQAYGEQHAVVQSEIDTLFDLTERKAEGEYVIRTRDGRQLTWDFSSVGMGRLPDGRRAAISMAFDVTERNAILAKLRESEAHYRRILDHSPDLVFINRDDKVYYINPEGLRLLKARSPEQVIGLSIYQLFEASTHTQISQRIAKLRSAAGTSASLAYEPMITLDGGTLDVNVMAVSFMVEGHIDILVTCRDISDKRRSEETIADYVRRLESAVLGTASAVSQMVELRDPYTAGHERRVGELAAAIAAEMGLDENIQAGLRIAGAVHDVGKVMVPSEILSKPSRLSKFEFELVKEHAEQGYQVLKDVDFPWPVAQVALQHHERLDGSGYPQGLKGDAILLEARIIAVADVVESMSSHRPYRPALGTDAAMAEIERGCGTLYDPDAVAACLQLFREKAYHIPE